MEKIHVCEKLLLVVSNIFFGCCFNVICNADCKIIIIVPAAARENLFCDKICEMMIIPNAKKRCTKLMNLWIQEKGSVQLLINN